MDFCTNQNKTEEEIWQPNPCYCKEKYLNREVQNKYLINPCFGCDKTDEDLKNEKAQEAARAQQDEDATPLPRQLVPSYCLNRCSKNANKTEKILTDVVDYYYPEALKKSDYRYDFHSRLEVVGDRSRLEPWVQRMMECLCAQKKELSATKSKAKAAKSAASRSKNFSQSNIGAPKSRSESSQSSASKKKMFPARWDKAAIVLYRNASLAIYEDIYCTKQISSIDLKKVGKSIFFGEYSKGLPWRPAESICLKYLLAVPDSNRADQIHYMVFKNTCTLHQWLAIIGNILENIAHEELVEIRNKALNSLVKQYTNTSKTCGLDKKERKDLMNNGDAKPVTIPVRTKEKDKDAPKGCGKCIACKFGRTGHCLEFSKGMFGRVPTTDELCSGCTETPCQGPPKETKTKTTECGNCLSCFSGKFDECVNKILPKQDAACGCEKGPDSKGNKDEHKLAVFDGSKKKAEHSGRSTSRGSVRSKQSKNNRSISQRDRKSSVGKKESKKIASVQNIPKSVKRISIAEGSKTADASSETGKCPKLNSACRELEKKDTGCTVKCSCRSCRNSRSNIECVIAKDLPDQKTMMAILQTETLPKYRINEAELYNKYRPIPQYDSRPISFDVKLPKYIDRCKSTSPTPYKEKCSKYKDCARVLKILTGIDKEQMEGKKN